MYRTEKNLERTLTPKSNLLEEQWQILKALGNYCISHQAFTTAITYYQAALLLAEKHLPHFILQSLDRIDLTIAELIYQQLPQGENYEQGLIVRQICQARLRREQEVQEIAEQILSVAQCFAKAEDWEKAWYTAKCIVVWVQEKPWKLEKTLAVKAGEILGAIEIRNTAYFHQKKLLANFSLKENKLKLKNIRDDLKDDLSATTFLETYPLVNHFNEALQNFIQQLLDQCFAVVGLAPCDYTLLGLGSMARKEACVYSDLEFAVLIPEEFEKGKEREQVETYFSVLFALFECQVILLGETPLPPDSRVALAYLPTGFCLDEGGNVPFKKKRLFGTMDQLLENLHIKPGESGDMIAANVLQEAHYLAGSETLYKSFKNKRYQMLYSADTDKTLAKQFSLYLLHDHLNDFGEIKPAWPETINIKTEVMRPIIFTLNGLCLYFGISAHHSGERIDALIEGGILPASVGCLLKQQLAIAFRWRLQAHLFYGEECETAYLITSEADKAWSLDHEQKLWLTDLREGILKPLIKFLQLFIADKSFLKPEQVFMALESLFKNDASSDVFLRLIQYAVNVNNWEIAQLYCEQAKHLYPTNNVFLELETTINTAVKNEQQGIRALTNAMQALGSRKDNELFNHWQKALKTRDCTLLPFWREKKQEYFTKSQHKMNASLLSGCYLLGFFCQNAADPLHRKRVYRTFLRELPEPYRHGAVEILMGYEPLDNGKALLKELEIISPSTKGDGARPLLAQREAQWMTELLQILEPYDEVQKENAKASHRILVRFWHNHALQSYLLKTEYQALWMNNNGTFKEELRTLLDGKRIVVPVSIKKNHCIAYAKVYPEMPGIQLAVTYFIKRLSGHYLPHLLCQFVPLADAHHSYPVLFSQAGEKTLQMHLKESGTLKAIEEKLDRYYFTWHVIETLLLHPEDDKFDNLIACPFSDINGERCYRLVNIDSDHVFVDALVSRGLINKELKVQLKSAALCFDAMLKPLDPEAIEEFKQLQWYELLTGWLNELEQLHQQMTGDKSKKSPVLFTADDAAHYFAHPVDSSFVPMALELGTLNDIAQRFWRLQAIVDSEVIPESHLALLKQLEPRLADFYEKAFEKPTPEERFKALPTEYITVQETGKVIQYRSNYHTVKRFERSITIVDEQKKRNLKKAIETGTIACPEFLRTSELEGAYQYYRSIGVVLYELTASPDQGGNFATAMKKFAEATPFIKEQLLKRLDFALLSEASQLQLLEPLNGIALRELHLQNCRVLTDTRLRTLLATMPDLLSLNLKGCSAIGKIDISSRVKAFFTGNLITAIFSACPQLQKLDMSGTSITVFKANTFNALQQLILNDCNELTEITCQAPTKLLKFSTENCQKLTTIIVQARDLNHLNLANYKQLTNIQQFQIDNSKLITKNVESLPDKINAHFIVIPSRINLVLVGDSGAGKTTLLNRFVDGVFPDLVLPTVRPFFEFKHINFRGKEVKLEIWDTPGIEKLDKIFADYYRGRHGFIIVFDLTDERSLRDVIRRFKPMIDQNAETSTPYILAGSKSDLVDYRVISYERALDVAHEIGAADYLECSAKTGEGVDEIFMALVELCIEPRNYRREAPIASQTLLLLGTTDSGKTCLLNRFVDGVFPDLVLSNIGVDFKRKIINFRGKKIKLQIWDTGGKERFDNITTSYFRNKSGIIIVFNLTREDSLHDVIQRFKPMVDQHALPYILVGNRSDEVERRQVSYERALDVAHQIGAADYLECSAKTGEGVDEIFMALVELCIELSNYRRRAPKVFQPILGTSLHYFKPQPKNPAINVEELSNALVTRLFENKIILPSQPNAYDLILKLLLIGGTGTGKSCLLDRFVDGMFTDRFSITMGVDYKIKHINFSGKKIKLQIWDTCGLEIFDRITTGSYYRGTHGTIIVFDLIDKDSLRDVIQRFKPMVDKHAPPNTPIILAGNKSDMVDEREISYERALDVAHQIGAADYLECSAKTGEGVDDLFMALVELCIIDPRNYRRRARTISQPILGTSLHYFKPQPKNPGTENKAHEAAIEIEEIASEKTDSDKANKNFTP